MKEPMHQHEMVDLLWEYERPFMTREELTDWAERGFRAYLMEMPEMQLKTRYKRLEELAENFAEDM